MPSAGSILRQLSSKEAWRKSTSTSTSNRYSSYGGGNNNNNHPFNIKQINGNMSSMYDNNDPYHHHHANMMAHKRVMVVVDHTSTSKHAMLWALTHVTNKGDCLTLLHVIPPSYSSHSYSYDPNLASSLASLCKACKPQVEVEALAIQGPKLATVLSQVKKLEVSVLVLGQKKPSSIITCLFGMSNNEDIVEQCINNADCLTIGVRKQSKGMGGYLISTRWQKNFWLLA